MYRGKFEVTQEVEVTVEVDLDEVMKNIDHDDLLEALLEHGCDVSSLIGDMEPNDVLDELQHRDVVQWVVSNVDTDEILDAVKETDDDGLTGWLENHRDVLPVDVKTETPEVKPEPVTLVYPVIKMDDNKVYALGTNLSVGTYTMFNGMLFVDALGVQFVSTTVQSAELILSAVAFKATNATNTEV